ncbi:hypothetical protein [Streptomyces dangxiongensis]|uniref:hypothetical protein n=1 Tax=Streptomyces dangxiongensis TaxID=1442032 RepID=UPI001F0996F2|nr:hypothetical protein [Streptomyces dangxiongensis]
MHGETTGTPRRDAVGLREVLFQSVTAMAPAAAVAASIPSGAAFAGGSLPLAVLVSLVACLFTASCVAELARELPAARSVATYAARGLRPAVGFLVVTQLTAPVSYAGPVVGVWMAVGVLVLLILVRRHPERIAETARVHLDEYDPIAHRQVGTVPR